MIPPGRDGEQTENTPPEKEALIHVAKLPPPASHPSELWAAPDAALTGNIVLPDGRGTHALETVVTALAAALEPHLRGVSRVAIWRVPPCVALALTPVLRRLRVAPAWLNDRWSLRDASRALEIVAAPVVLQGVHTAHHFAPPHVAVLHVAPLPSHDIRVLRAQSPPPRPPAPACTDEALFFTSGSGGAPKCARLPNRAMDVQAREKINRLPLRRARAFLHLAPLYHVGGASSALAAMMVGCDHVVPRAGAALLARAAHLLDRVRAHRVAVVVVVPAVLAALADAAVRAQVKAARVRAVLIGGARASSSLLRVAHAAFPNAEFIAAYGLTECASSLAFGSAGAVAARAPAHVELAVRASARGRRGHVVTRGPHVMRGYVGDATRSRSDWFDTGDVGAVDESGALVLAGRARDVIRSAGESVHPIEVEEALAAHHAVARAAVIGLPHRILGEAVVAAVTLRTSVDACVLKEWCRARLSPFKVPRVIVPMPDLPTNALGKVVRPALRSLLVDRLAGHARLAKL